MKNQITKDVLKLLRSVYQKTGTLIEMFEKEESTEKIYLFFLSIIGELVLCCVKFINVLRMDTEPTAEKMIDEQKLSDEEIKILVTIFDKPGGCSFDDFTKVYEIMKRGKK